MKKLLWLMTAVVLLSVACTDRRSGGGNDAPADSTGVADSVPNDTLEELISETPMPKAADELFDDFIFNFAASKKVQLARIHFPLQVVKGEEHEQVQKSGWTTDHFFMQQGFYTLIFSDEAQMQLCNDTSVNHVTLEKIYLNKKFVKQYVFGRENGLWMMQRVQLIDLDESPNASFLNFYSKFVADSLFQVESLSATVDFVGPDPDDDFAQMEGVITKDTWPAFAPELPSDMIYNIIYGDQTAAGDKRVFVIRGIANGFEVELTFKQSGEHWRLTKLVT
jgi:hypothetical protein